MQCSQIFISGIKSHYPETLEQAETIVCRMQLHDIFTRRSSASEIYRALRMT